MARTLGRSLLVMLITAVSADLAPGYRTNSTVDCHIDDDKMNPSLRMCLDKGYTFISDFLKHMKKERRQPFDKCRSFKPFQSCINPMLENCPSIHNEVHRHWIHVVNSMNCVCSGNLTCQSDFECFEEQMSDVLVKRCDAVYKFNIQQKTRTKCFFLRDNINCKDAILTSSCGNSSGEFGYHLFKVAARGQINTERCFIPRDHSYNGFRYTPECPQTMLADIAHCQEDHLEKDKLEFYEANDLVSHGGKKAVKRACRSLKSYHRCVKHVNTTCHRGLKHVHEYDGNLRTYLMKMEFICKEAKDVYADSLPCFQAVLQNKTYAQCDVIWRDMKPLLDIVTSHKYFCQERVNETKIFEEDLTRLRMCYEEVFNKSCGKAGSATLGSLISRAFEDPLYLRLTYKPDCELHMQPSKTTVITTSTKTTWPTVKIVDTDNKDKEPRQVRESKLEHASSVVLSTYSIWLFVIPWIAQVVLI